MKLEISLFRFDKDSDYLPYYTKNFIKVKNQKNLLDILNTIEQENSFGYKNSLDFNVVVNGVFLNVDISIDKLVNSFGKDLTIEPISIRRSHTDLLINEDDFNDRLKILSKFIDEDDKKAYETYKIYFYASNSINLEYNYIGDSLLLLAYDLIEKNSSLEEDILKELSSHDFGAQYHTSLEDRVYNFDKTIENKISIIKKKLNLTKDIKEQEFFLERKNFINFGKYEEPKEIKYDFKNFNLAYYQGSSVDEECLELLSKLDAKILNLDSMKYSIPLDTFHINPEFSLKIAGMILLDAFDNAADLVIVDNDEIFKLFDSNRKKLYEQTGREIIIPIIHKNELSQLVSGEHVLAKETLNKHKINPDII